MLGESVEVTYTSRGAHLGGAVWLGYIGVGLRIDCSAFL